MNIKAGTIPTNTDHKLPVTTVAAHKFIYTYACEFDDIFIELVEWINLYETALKKCYALNHLTI